MFDRLRYGKVVEEGLLTPQKKKEFEKLFSQYGLVNVELIHTRNSYPGLLSRTFKEEGEFEGQVSWKNLEVGIESLASQTKTPFDDIPFVFRRRKRKQSDFVEVKASGMASVYSSHLYYGKISSRR